MAKGGKVKDPEGQTTTKKLRPDRQWGDTKKVAEEIPEAPEKKAKGGVLRRRPLALKAAKAKQPIPAPNPGDYETGGGTAPPVAGPPAAAGLMSAMKKGGKMRKSKGGECKTDKMAVGGAAKSGGAGKQRKGFPKTLAPKRLAEGGKVRGCGAATKGCTFSGVY
jgi:hypothetical protein